MIYIYICVYIYIYVCIYTYIPLGLYNIRTHGGCCYSSTHQWILWASTIEICADVREGWVNRIAIHVHHNHSFKAPSAWVSSTRFHMDVCENGKTFNFWPCLWQKMMILYTMGFSCIFPNLFSEKTMICWAVQNISSLLIMIIVSMGQVMIIFSWEGPYKWWFSVVFQ